MPYVGMKNIKTTGTMKHFFLMILVGMFALPMHAQHLDFMGFPMGSSIADFTVQIRQRYPMQRKVGGDQYYIYMGPIFGHNTYFKAEYTKKTKTVYKITVTPKNVDQTALLDSLVAHYGEPLEIENGYRWNREGGVVLFYTPQGYDPVLFYIDEEGTAVFRSENEKKKE